MELITTVPLVLLLLAAYGHAAPASCGIPLAERDECGWEGISEAECQARGCCFNVDAATIKWCYHPIGSNPCLTNPCLTYETCLPSLNGASYTCTCPSGRTADGKCKTVTDSTCSVSNVLLRRPCGYKGITEAECKENGCCYDVNAETTYWCYRTTPDSNPCNSFPCRRSETCVRNGASYACTCPSGRSGIGSTCNTAADAKCQVEVSQRKLCGWFGISQSQCAEQGCCFEPNAQTINWCFKQVADPCANSPCKNGGVCNNNGDSFTCTCSSSWTGIDCGTANPCGSSPCKNGGACTNSGSSYTCACTAAWTGSDCTTVADPCQAGPCKHGGTCTAVGTSFTCSCVAGWTGNDCTTEVNVCLKSNPCQNGGTCVKFGDSYECKCPANWAGTNCEIGSAACHAVLPENRINCGWGGVTLEQCNGRSCCFDPMTGRPACFYAVVACDTMDTKLRVDCGFSGISYAQCVGRGCCFDDDEETNPTGPVCYRKANPDCIGVKATDRVTQGDAGIQPNECNAKGWCWDSSAVPNCFTRV